jgi:hypothetical protein
MSEKPEPLPVLLTPFELVARWHFKITVRTLENWRYRKQGPAWQRIGGRIMYPIDFVIEYEQDNTVIPKEKRKCQSLTNTQR